jgi:transcriptional regulator with XRE-family HTH domain
MNLLSERLKWAMAEESRRQGEEIRPADLARAAKTSATSVNFWLNDVNGIGASKARLLADYLHVDPLWLETGQGRPNGRADPDELSRGEAELLRVYRLAAPADREFLIGVADAVRRRMVVEGTWPKS